MNKDDLFKLPINIEDFVFDESVSHVFDDMVDRSVPGYRTLISNIAVIANNYLQQNSNCYDLGCSHAACLLAIFKSNHSDNIKFIGVDQSAAMVAESKKLVSLEQENHSITIALNDVTTYPIENASVVILNLTLQFIAPEKRDQLIQKIYAALLPGGALILTEKVQMLSPQEDALFDHLHESFKKHSGYTELEISQKRKTLEKVLIKETELQHIDRLREAGFSSVHCWFRCYQFISLLAVK